MKVVIIGGVAGGATTAARLRRLDESAEIVILERGSFISYANCGLPYFVGGTIEDRGDLELQTPASFNARFAVDVRARAEAVKIDTAAKTVTVRNLDTGEETAESYDNLVIAPGASANVPDFVPRDDERVFTLRTIPDARAPRRMFRTLYPGTMSGFSHSAPSRMRFGSRTMSSRKSRRRPLSSAAALSVWKWRKI